MADSLRSKKHNGSNSSLCPRRCCEAWRGAPRSRYTNLWRARDTGGAGPRLTLGGHGEGVGSVSHPGHDRPRMGSHPGNRLAPCRSKGNPRVGDLGWKGSPVQPPHPELGQLQRCITSWLCTGAEPGPGAPAQHPTAARSPCAPHPQHGHPPWQAGRGPEWVLLLVREFRPGKAAGARQRRLLRGRGWVLTQSRTGDAATAERRSWAAAAPSTAQGNLSPCTVLVTRAVNGPCLISPTPCPQSRSRCHPPGPPPPHPAPALSEAVLRSSVVFSVIPRGWRGTVVGCPSPVLLVLTEVGRAREGSGVPGSGLQWQIAAGEDGGTLGVAIQLPPTPAHLPLTRRQPSPKQSSGPRLSSPLAQGGGGGQSRGAHLLSSLFPWKSAGPGKGLESQGPGCNGKLPPVRTAARWGVLVLLRFPLPAMALSSFCPSCSQRSPWLWPPQMCR